MPAVGRLPTHPLQEGQAADVHRMAGARQLRLTDEVAALPAVVALHTASEPAARLGSGARGISGRAAAPLQPECICAAACAVTPGASSAPCAHRHWPAQHSPLCLHWPVHFQARPHHLTAVPLVGQRRRRCARGARRFGRSCCRKRRQPLLLKLLLALVRLRRGCRRACVGGCRHCRCCRRGPRGQRGGSQGGNGAILPRLLQHLLNLLRSGDDAEECNDDTSTEPEGKAARRWRIGPTPPKLLLNRPCL